MENSFTLSTISNEYNMLMTALHISVSKHLLNDDFTVIWANSYFYDMTDIQKKNMINYIMGIAAYILRMPRKNMK